MLVADYKLHQTNKRVNYEKKVHNKKRSAKKIKEANPIKKTNAKECSKHHLTDLVEQNYDICVAKSKEPVLQSSKITGGLSYVVSTMFPQTIFKIKTNLLLSRSLPTVSLSLL